MTECKGCAERRAKFIAAANAMIEWMKNPRGQPPHVLPPPDSKPDPNDRPQGS